MTQPVANNLCHDLVCAHRSICLRWCLPVDPLDGHSLYPPDHDGDCPHLLDRQTLGGSHGT